MPVRPIPMKLILSPLALSLAILPLFAVPVPVQEEAPPSGRKQKELIAALFEVDAYAEGGRTATDELLAPYAHLPAPEGSASRLITKSIAKAWSKERKLPAKKGQHWYWEDEKRGRFFVAGQLRKPKGLFIGLHGGGLGSADASGAYQGFQAAASKRKWASIYPQALEATEHGWTDSGTEEWVMRLIDEARRTFDVPADRIYIGGHSMGGYGTWTLGAHHADLFAAGVASAGAPTPVYSGPGEKIIDVETGVVPSLRNLPLLVYQSTDDPNVPAAVNQAANGFIGKAKKKYGGYEDFTYWEVEGRGHAYPEGGTEELLQCIQSFERNPHPRRVVWQPALSWRTSFYWLDWPKPSIGAVVDATVDREKGTIDIVVKRGDAAGLGVLLSSDVVDMEKELVITLNGKEVHRGVPVTSWSTFVRTSLLQDPGRLYAARVALQE